RDTGPPRGKAGGNSSRRCQPASAPWRSADLVRYSAAGRARAAMSDFESSDSKNGFSMKLWRGERMWLVGFGVDQPESDLVGFAIECRSPGSRAFFPLRNRIAFSYDQPPGTAVTGDLKFGSTVAPFQKFRWVHFPYDPRIGTYTYRGTKMHMPTDGHLVKG